MINRTKLSKEITLANLLKEAEKPKKKFEYNKNIVKNQLTLDSMPEFKTLLTSNKKQSNNLNKTKPQKLTPIINKSKSELKFPLKIPKKSTEILNSKLLNRKRILGNKPNDQKENDKSVVKKHKKDEKKGGGNVKKKKKDLFLESLGLTPEEVAKSLEESKKRKEEEQAKLNEILTKNIMGTQQRKFITQYEEEKERLEKEKEIEGKSKMSYMGPIPHTTTPWKTSQEKYRSFRPHLNDIFSNVLSFQFYVTDREMEEVPNTFDNEAHYRYIWVTDFFSELKFSLLNEKIEKSELQNYEDVDIRLNLSRLNDIDDKLTSLKMTTNKKLYELKRRILKDNDIIAVYNEKCNYDKEQISLKNEYELNYFLGIVTRENDNNNDLNLLVLKEDYENYVINDIPKTMQDDFIYYDKKVKYLGTINSLIREYKALLDLQISNFTSIIKTDTIFLNHKKDDINEKQNYEIPLPNCYTTEKDKFLHSITKSKIFNEPQKNAIFKANSMKNNEILLIQGPPGTGKTHTILGLVSLFLKNNLGSKILICAPSNAAIDEICARLARKGVYNSELGKVKCKFLRFGLYDRKDKEKKYLETMNGKILEKYSLEFLSDEKYKKDIDNLSERLEKYRKQLYALNKEKDKNKNYIKNVEAEISGLLKLLSDKRYQKSLYEHDILISTPILCTTLNNAGNERLKRAKLSYEHLIVDEASQCVEPSCLIPLCHEVKKLILVGDHMQLPATVFNPRATKILYNRSLFERLIDNKFPRYILTVQYRMQKNISEFVSKVFYDGKLSNDQNHVDTINKELMYSLIKIENNFSFFDIAYGEESFDSGKKSYFNESEIKFSFFLVKKLINLIRNQINKIRSKYQKIEKNVIKIDENGKISEEKQPEELKEVEELSKDDNEKINKFQSYKFAIICAYKSQVMKFREIKKNDKFFKDPRINDIEINTVDSFQGQERDIIIFSTVRANFKDDISLEEGEIKSVNENDNTSSNNNNGNNIGIGFLNDFRRMNVGLSRAKVGCFVVGNYETLKNNSYWKKLMDYCKEKKSFFNVEKSKEYDAINNNILV